MLNSLIVFAALTSVLLAGFSGHMQDLTAAAVSSARDAVDLALGLVGLMAFFLGLMRVAEDAGLLRHLAKLVGPIMKRLFPDVPADSPAMSAMVLNISTNMLGLGNAATPFGIKAMEELDKLNTSRGTATNAMVLFLAINTSALAILPSGVVALRASVGSADAMGIFLPTWFASGCATLVAITAALLLSRFPLYRTTNPTASSPNALERTEAPPISDPPESQAPEPRRLLFSWLFWSVWTVALTLFLWNNRDRSSLELFSEVASAWMLPTLIATLILYGWVREIRVYDSLVEGAKQGFEVALRIIPYLVAILVVVGMFRASGGIDLFTELLAPLTSLIGMPAEALPMALLRPLTGSGAFAIMTEAMTVHGADSLIGYMVSTFQGSTETTFYTLAVYYGSIGIRNTRHTVPVCLLADTAGILGGVFIVNLMFG